MQFLSFRNTWWVIRLEAFNKEIIRCPEGLFEEIKAICFEKMPQIQTEIDKNSDFLKFSFNFILYLERAGGLEF